MARGLSSRKSRRRLICVWDHGQPPKSRRQGFYCTLHLGKTTVIIGDHWLLDRSTDRGLKGINRRSQACSERIDGPRQTSRCIDKPPLTFLDHYLEALR